MKNLETREQAEAMALNEIAKELGYYHWEHFLKDHDTPEKLFHAGVEYANKSQRRIRRCVERISLDHNNIPESVYNANNQLLTVKQAESICIGFYKDLVSHLESGLSTELFHGEIVFNKQLEKALK